MNYKKQKLKNTYEMLEKKKFFIYQKPQRNA